MPNRLAAERSPYLLQHATNPVDWYPWGDDAFARARAEDKPIFVSIGYSTCHWCHVMEHESFENDSIAELLNASYVSIKVDREERPDVDRVYMTFVQATTGAGGWPMSVFLTPELKPFYGGTYFPPASRWGRPGFIDLLREIAQAWRADRSRIEEIAATLTDRIRGATAAFGAAGPDSPPPSSFLDAGVDQFVRTFDRAYGGFGNAPKFPRPSELLFLLREHARTGSEPAEHVALETLRAMAFGGMRDHVGGGFHRYSVDRAWRVPHFEKMLYDQAQLVLAYLEASQVAHDPFYAVVAEDTLEYVRRDLTSPEGGFYSAEDADSIPPEFSGVEGAQKSEGAFYLWTERELDDLLSEDSRIVKLRFGVLPNGNAPEDPHGEFTGRNILYTAAPVEEIARQIGRAEPEVVDVLGRARPLMFYARAKRPRPHLDDKVLTAWNGLMIAAFARASRVLVESARAPLFLETACKAASFLRSTLWHAGTRTLRRRYRAGEAAIDAYCEDYACLVWSLIELFQADGDPQWLEWALELQSRQDALFADPQGGWFSTTGEDPTVLLRLKEDYDGAEPAAASVAAQNALWLAHLTGRDDLRRSAERALAQMQARGQDATRVAPFMAAVLSTYHAGIRQVVLAGSVGAGDTRALRAVVASQYLPFHIVIPAGDDRASLDSVVPLIGDMQPRDGRATAYVCQDFHCEAPVQEPEALRALLRAGDSRDR
ncbi:MAG: thioredoxin domain-containing protein [Acidobacteriota bacterium]